MVFDYFMSKLNYVLESILLLPVKVKDICYTKTKFPEYTS